MSIQDGDLFYGLADAELMAQASAGGKLLLYKRVQTSADFERASRQSAAFNGVVGVFIAGLIFLGLISLYDSPVVGVFSFLFAGLLIWLIAQDNPAALRHENSLGWEKLVWLDLDARMLISEYKNRALHPDKQVIQIPMQEIELVGYIYNNGDALSFDIGLKKTTLNHNAIDSGTYCRVYEGGDRIEAAKVGKALGRIWNLPFFNQF
jgi:hypothetical protein